MMMTPKADPRDSEIGAVRAVLADLRGWYVVLFGATGKDGRSPTAEARGGGSTEPAAPVNLDVVDLIVRIERTVDRVETMTRRTLFSLPPAMRHDRRNRAGDAPRGLVRVRVPVPSTGDAPRWAHIHRRTVPASPETTTGVTADQRVLDALRWLSEVVPDVIDGGYRQDLVVPLIDVHRVTKRTLGLSERIYRLESVCPFCGLPSILARPERDLVACGNPVCRDEAGNVRSWQTLDVARQRADEERRRLVDEGEVSS